MCEKMLLLMVDNELLEESLNVEQERNNELVLVNQELQNSLRRDLTKIKKLEETIEELKEQNLKLKLDFEKLVRGEYL